MHSTFSKELIYVDDIVVYLKNERTGSSTLRKCKFVGQVVELTNTKVRIRRLSLPDIFVTPEEIKNFGIDTVYPNEVVHIIISKYDRDITKTLEQVNNLVDKYKTELEFTRKFIHEHGLEFELASAWDKHKVNT